MTDEPRCTCHVAVTTPEWVDPEDFPPMRFHVNYCALHKAAPDLLEACEAALKCVALLTPFASEFSSEGNDELREAIDLSAAYADAVRAELREAIFKAKGTANAQ